MDNNINSNNSISSVSPQQSVSSQTAPAAQSSSNNSIMTKQKEELFKKLGITESQYIALVNENSAVATMSEQELVNYISKHYTNNQTESASAASPAPEQAANAAQAAGVSTPEEFEETTAENPAAAAENADSEENPVDTAGFFNKAEFSKLSRDQKVNVYIQEYAKNSYMYSDYENKKTEEDWNALTDEEKAKYLNESKNTLAKTYGELFSIVDDDVANAALDKKMTDILAANRVETPMAEYDKFEDEHKNELIYDYLFDANAMAKGTMSAIDKKMLEVQTQKITAVEYLSGRQGENLCPDSVRDYMHDNNITSDIELEKLYLEKKYEQEGSLSGEEWKRLKALRQTVDVDLHDVIYESKALGLEKLKEERAAALEKGNLDRVAELDKVINSEDSKKVEQWKKENAEALSELPKEPTQSYLDFKDSEYGNLYSDANTKPGDRALIMMAYIKQNYPEDKWGEVAADLMKGLRVDDDSRAIETQLAFMQYSFEAMNELDARRVSDSAHVDVNAATATKLINAASKYAVRAGRIAAASLTKAYQQAGEKGQKHFELLAQNMQAAAKENNNDDVKLEVTTGLHELNHVTQIGKNNVDLSNQIKDVEKQRKSHEATMRTANAEVKTYGTLQSYLAHEDNQLFVYDGYMKDCKEAIRAAADDGTYTKLNSKVQTDAYKLLNQHTIENFSGSERIDLLNRASDHISDAAEENQLDMHNEALNLGYSEVQEHVSGNIYKYAESVQADALNATKATGNDKAVDAAMANYDKYADSVKENPKYQEMQRETEARKVQEVADAVAEFHVQYEKLTGMKANIDNEASDQDTKLAYVKAFLNASPQEQFKMLSKIPASWQGTVYSKMVTYCPQLLSSLVRQGYGKAILNTPGLSSEVIYKVINVMLTSQTSDKKAAVKYVKAHKSMFNETTLDRVEELSKSDSMKKQKKYVSQPAFATVKGALKPKQSAIYPNQDELEVYNA